MWLLTRSSIVPQIKFTEKPLSICGMYEITQQHYLLSLQMSTPFHAKLMKAQSTCVQYATVFSEPLVCMCVSDAIGCPLEFIIFPLLTIIAGCMGINAHVAINQMWTEPAIIWFIVAANKGQKKNSSTKIEKTIGSY